MNATPAGTISYIHVAKPEPMSRKRKWPKAVFHFRKNRALPLFMDNARHVVAQIEKNSTVFSSLQPAPAQIKVHIKELEKAEAEARKRTIGMAAKRDVKWDVVIRDVYKLVGYVQGLADKEMDEAKAKAIILKAGLSIKGTRGKGKDPFTVKHGKRSGEIILSVKAVAKRASYQFQISTNGKTWTDLKISLDSKVVVVGLAEGSKQYFRFRAITKDGEQRWSDAKMIVVV